MPASPTEALGGVRKSLEAGPEPARGVVDGGPGSGRGGITAG
ncbi:hypothetical protein ACGFIV_16350 [Sphaerisporangium sp. NPDC049003]